MRKFLNKLTCVALSLTFLMGCMATPAFAYSGGETDEKTTVTSIFDTEDEEPVTVTEQDAGPLTPEGNLTVVDDYQTTFSDGTAQQFITLVSKSGAYFYLIIDRAADGDQTAHFLNMVDEADLLALMDEEDIPEPEPEPAPAPEPEPMPEPEPEEEDGAGKFVLVLLVLAGIAGGGAYFWLKMQQKKREAEENKPDPDADYREDEEEIVLPDEPDAEADEDAERKEYQGNDGYEE